MEKEALNQTEIRITPLSNYTVNPKINEKQFDEFTALIANLCEIPKAVITIIDEDKLWLKSSLGIPKRFIYYKKSFCQFTISDNAMVEISDVDADTRLIGHTWTSDHPDIKFYAGVPITTEDGIIGTLCIMDDQPHVLSARQKEMLQDLGKMVSSLMQSRKNKIPVASENNKPLDHPSISLRSMRSITRSW